MWKYNQSWPRVESISQSEQSIQMASHKRGLEIHARLKNMPSACRFSSLSETAAEYIQHLDR